MAKLNRQQLNAIKEKVRQQKAAAAHQKKVEELKLKESSNTQDLEDTTPKTLKDVKALLEKQKQEAVQNGKPQKSKKQQIKQLKREVKGSFKSSQNATVNWNISIGDLVFVPERWSGVGEFLYGIVVKMTEDKGSGRRSNIANDSTQIQILTTGGFKWFYAKSLRKIENV